MEAKAVLTASVRRRPDDLDYLQREDIRFEGQLLLTEEHATESIASSSSSTITDLLAGAARARACIKDADHTLALMDFVKAHLSDEWTLSHEQYRPCPVPPHRRPPSRN